MNIEEYRDYCLSLTGVSEEFPFDINTLVFKVMGKMFALTNVDSFVSMNLKADPEYSIELREMYSGVNPGFHMNKRHWNTVILNGTIPEKIIKGMIDDSYDLVLSKLSKKNKEMIIKE